MKRRSPKSREIKRGRAAIVVVPAFILLGIHNATGWVHDVSGRAFDRMLVWAGFEL